MEDLKGIFITFEGGEGSGKDTQVDLFLSYLKNNNYSFESGREPGGIEFSEKVRNLALNAKYEKSPTTQLFLFEASRSEYVSQLVIPSLKKGNIFVSNRFYDSTTAYQGYAGGIDLSSIQRLNMLATDNLKPDLTFIINIPARIGLQRAGKLEAEFEEGDFFESKGYKFHETVNNAYLEIAKKEPKRCKVIDGTQSINNVFNDIVNIFEEYISNR